ncbi:MAG: rhomboid family intramembrane serine protease [Gammaproteobacteria bacterium]|nr:MAG: rhomboid family intramembrane serine protease [Gammaproteobacteria bacterium]
MDNSFGGEGAAPGSPSGANPRDGAIDFTRYSDAQLEELKYTIDPRSSPLSYAHLIAELERRRAQATEPPSAPASSPGRFTPRDGLFGWLQAKRGRSPVYGSGSIECGPVDVALDGWRRTWLGVAHRDEVRLPLEGVRNVGVEKARLEFEYKQPYRLRKRIHFIADSEAKARELAAKLPATQTAGFQQQWSELREFKVRLAEVGGRAWVTPVLVLLNLAVFVAMAASARRLGAFDPVLLFSWGANVGTVTINGQWWRLATALFVHLSLLHLVLNLWALWNVGRLTERLYGTGVFVFLYFTSGLLGNLASIAWDPSNTSAGASSAIFGLFGAFLAFLAHRGSRVPAQVVRAHWFSTLLFVLFNLIQGTLTPHVDNAAHVGGLLGGFVLGWILVRPLEAESRQEFPFHKTVTAVFVLGVAVLVALTQVLGFGSQLTPPERYSRTHLWYLQGQEQNLRLWQELAVLATSGSISDAELGARFEREIVPFWSMADQRLKKESPSLPADQGQYAALVADFTQLRFKWAQAIVQATKNQDADAASKAIQLQKETDLGLARLERLELRASMSHRPRALADSPIMVRIRAVFTRRLDCVQKPYGPRLALTDASNDGPAARYHAGCRAQQLFLSGDFAALDSLMTRAVRSLGDLPDGGSSLEGIVGGLDTLMYYGGMDVRTLLARTASWRRAVPGSVQADLIEALAFRNWAWTARGHGSANEVSQQSWALFAHRIEMAAAALEDLAQRDRNHPLWYQLFLDVGLDQSRERGVLRPVFDQGAEEFPNYQGLYRSMLRIEMPRWGGSYQMVDGIVDYVAYGGHDTRDLEKYAQLYWIYDSLENDDINVFEDASAKWSNMKAGFILMVRHHPRSDVVINGFARFACLGGDPEQYVQLRPRLKEHYSATAWSAKVSLESCDKKFRIAQATMTGG